MNEKELIGRIQELRQIKPRKDWVVLTKKEILGEESYRERFSDILEIFPRILFQYKPAFASLILIFVLISTFVFTQKSLPGDFLYSLKRITERGQAIFVSKEEEPKMQLELANRRLEELTKIAEENQVKKLAPAIEEYQASLSQAAKKIAQIKETKEVRKIVPEYAKLEKNIENLKVYGVEVGEAEELNNALAQFVESRIKDLENLTLTEVQQNLLEEAKKDFEIEDYSSALIKIWEAGQIR